MAKCCKISGIMNQNEMEVTAKRCVKNELSLKTKLDVIRDSNGKSHRQLAERYNIDRSQVGNILRNKRKYLDAFENNEPASRKRLSTRNSTRLVWCSLHY